MGPGCVKTQPDFLIQYACGIGAVPSQVFGFSVCFELVEADFAALRSY